MDPVQYQELVSMKQAQLADEKPALLEVDSYRVPTVSTDFARDLLDEALERRLTGGELGHLKKNDLPSLRYLREFRTNEEIEAGETLTVEVFTEGERVDIVGKSKGRGFQGVVKRYGFSGGPKTHGQSDRHRAPGSIGAGSTPGRVFKGKRMPGRMGNETVTSQNLLISRIDPENNLIAVRGSVPGPKNGLVIIKEARKQ